MKKIAIILFVLAAVGAAAFWLYKKFVVKPATTTKMPASTGIASTLIASATANANGVTRSLIPNVLTSVPVKPTTTTTVSRPPATIVPTKTTVKPPVLKIAPVLKKPVLLIGGVKNTLLPKK